MNFLGPLCVFSGTALCIDLLRRTVASRFLADHPNERSLHSIPTPRVGGLGMFASFLPAAWLLTEGPCARITVIAAVLMALSAIDDARSLSVAVRLACHCAAAALAAVVVGHHSDSLFSAGIVLTCLACAAVVWMTNLFNFMDGADGLAGGMAGIGFSTFAIAALRGGAPDIAMLCALLAAAAAAFLLFNFPPARIFLGDAGSVPIGFLSAAVGWLGHTRGVWPAWFPVLVFSPFVVDATVTLLRRMAAGEPFWRAHRSHYYQRLVIGGWSHRRLAMHAWALMASGGASALVAREGSAAMQAAILLAWVVGYAVLAAGIDRRHPRQSS